jgi:aspartyl protease family protein
VRRSAFKSSMLALLFMASAGLPGLSRPVKPDMPMAFSMTELKAGSNGHFITTASINGQDIQVLVDTGASAVALSYEDAEQAGLKPHSLDYNIPVSTANGVANAASVILRRVEVDGVKVDDVQGMVLPQGAFRGTLLGMSFLAKLRGFNVENGVLTLKN